MKLTNIECQNFVSLGIPPSPLFERENIFAFDSNTDYYTFDKMVLNLLKDTSIKVDEEESK